MMAAAQDYYPSCPEGLIVSLARGGDAAAFEELVRRRQSSVRNLMRRFCGNPSLADDLAQQAFLRLWMSIRTLRRTAAFNSWFRRIAVSTWLQHVRRKDALAESNVLSGMEAARAETPGVAMDLDRALARLPAPERTCVVLSYHEGMSHREIADATGLPLGTVKSHVRRGSERVREALAAYEQDPSGGAPE